MENKLEGTRGETRAPTSKAHVITQVKVNGDMGHDGSRGGGGM